VIGSRLPLWGTIAGLVVGTVIAGGLFAGGVLQTPSSRDLSDAQDTLLAAWSRSRSGTFIVESEFRRTIDGRTLYSPTELVQRPPDRLVRQFGGASGVINGHVLVCATDQSDSFSCKEGTEQADPHDDVVRREIEDLRGLFAPPQPGAKPLYRVIRGVDGGCFELIRQLPIDDAPYGTYGKLCFDEATGALTELERHLDRGVVERQHATSIRTNVIENDFDTSSDEGYGMSMDMPAPAVQGTPATEPEATAPPPASTAVPEPDDDAMAELDLAALLAEGAEAPTEHRSSYAGEAVVRIYDGRASINDPAWRAADGQPVALAEPVVRVLLARGAIPVG
jgi:hypothetical protein